MMLTLDDYLALPPVVADARVAYGPAPEQFGDLYLPAGPGPHPALVLIHGGCWRARYDLAPLGGLCAALRAEGFVIWSLEYRRIGAGGGWPSTLADVAAGADALMGLGTPIDPRRVLAAGHSAGGQLALWLATRPRLRPDSPLWSPAPLPLAGVLALAALADLNEAVQRGLCGSAVVELLGGRPDEQPARYSEASPAAWIPLGLPVRHLAGAADETVPPDYLQAHVAQARAAGDDVELTLLPEAGHFEVVTPQGRAWAVLRRAARELAGLE
jgi:acetyl esterase/lipase